MIKRYMVTIDRNELPKTYDGVYEAGIFQGLLYGLCAVPCETTLWDCEMFPGKFVIFVDCTQEHIEKFKSVIDRKYPDTYQIEEWS